MNSMISAPADGAAGSGATVADWSTMGSERKERQRAAVRDEIKATARTHMARDGAASLSLRAVASSMGLSAAAIYYYYPNRDALITDLIVDAYRSLAHALHAADAGREQHDIADRLYAVLLAYRAWAIAAPAEFELIFGAPIPGYHAPPDVTAPEARAALQPLGALFGAAHARGRLHAGRDAPALPTALATHAEAWLREHGQSIPVPVLLAMLHAWGLGHGLVALELNGQLQPLIGDAGALFEHAVRSLLHTLGVLAAPAKRSFTFMDDGG